MKERKLRILNFAFNNFFFTYEAQLAEIKKTSEFTQFISFFIKTLNSILFLTKGMARILCDNSDGTVAKLQPKTFFAANGLT